MANQPPTGTHRWHFFRAGGFDQVNLVSGADLTHLDQLDQKLWVALACPATGLEFDPRTLQLIDTDRDGRIRAPEIIAAARWAGAMLKSPDDLLRGAAELSLSAINDASPEGKALLASAKQILVNLGKSDARAITIEDASDSVKIFANTRFNGDGIIPPEAAEDDATKKVIEDIIACLGADTDRSGKPGVSQAKVDQFFADAQAFSDWQKKSEAEAAAVLPLGDKTAAAAAAVRAVRAKVDDYFGRCRLAAFDPRAQALLNRKEDEYLTFAAKDLSLSAGEVAGFPLAKIEPGKPLPLKDSINPAWSAAMAALVNDAIKPVLGDKTSLTEADWTALTGKLASYDSWQGSQAGGAVAKLGLARVREILKGEARNTLTALVGKDAALKPEADAIANVERLARYHRDLFKLCNNFVNFRDFYGRKDKAVFQAGTLYLDQRSCDLCLRVEDAPKHGVMATLAGAYLAYLDCTRKSDGAKLTICAAFTAGDSDNLMVGRNGIFYDRQGRDYDATITKIVDHPISIRQAFWAPYKKLARMIDEQVAKRAAAAEAASDKKLATTAEAAASADQAKPAEPSRKVDVGVVAALGVAVGAIGTAMAYFLGLFKGLVWWQFPLIIIGIMLLISAPSMLIAALKLRKRNLGPILDANGWAVNSRARINIPFGGSLTDRAVLPPGSHRDLADPYGEKNSPWKLYLFLLILIALGFSWYRGRLDDYLPDRVRSTTVLGVKAPANTPPPAPPTLEAPPASAVPAPPAN